LFSEVGLRDREWIPVQFEQILRYQISCDASSSATVTARKLHHTLKLTKLNLVILPAGLFSK
jgi:hypothetical protein